MNLSFDPIAEDFVVSDPALPGAIRRVYIEREATIENALAALEFLNSLRIRKVGVPRPSLDKPREIVYDESQVRRFGKGGQPLLTLEDLEIDFEDEEIFA